MYAPQGLPAVYYSVLASSVRVTALGLLSEPGITMLPNEIPLVQIARFVQGVYFAPRGIKNATS